MSSLQHVGGSAYRGLVVVLAADLLGLGQRWYLLGSRRLLCLVRGGFFDYLLSLVATAPRAHLPVKVLIDSTTTTPTSLAFIPVFHHHGSLGQAVHFGR